MSRHVLVVAAIGACLCGTSETALAQQGWSGTAAVLSAPAGGLGAAREPPDLAADASGNVIAVWGQRLSPMDAVVQCARFSAFTRAWGPPSNISAVGPVGSPRVVLDPAGNAFAIWLHSVGLQAARYLRSSNTWSSPVDLAIPGQPTHDFVVSTDADGNAFAAWVRWNGVNDIVQATRFSTGTGAWSPSVDLSASGQNALGPRLVVDAGGNAIAIWSRNDGTNWIVQARRYSAGTGLWSAASDLSVDGSAAWPDIVVSSDGDATAAWSRYDGTYSRVQARRFIAASQAWGPVVNLSAPDEDGQIPRLAADPGGNVFAVWIQQSTFLQAARFSVTSGAWSTPVPISAPWEDDTNFEVKPDAAGNATVVWVQHINTPIPGTALQAARYVAISDTWTPATTLEVSGAYLGRHETAVDSAGNVLVIWSRSGLRAARFVVTADAWTPATDIPASTAGLARLAFDPLNNATAVWHRFDTVTVSSVVVGTRWLATPAAPAIGVVAPSPGTLSVAFTAPATTEPLFAPTNYAYSINDGAMWTLRDPASTVSPVLIGGLVDFVPYTLRLIAINSAGAGSVSGPVVAVPGPVPGAPTMLTATRISGNTVTLSWTAPAAGAVPTGYALEGGVNPGEVLASIPTGSTAPTFTFVAPTGAFYVRMHALAGALRSAPSNEIRIFVNVPTPPSAPGNLLGLVNGSTIALSWTNTFGGGAPASLWLNVTGAITTTLPLPMGEAFTYVNVPPGTYTLSVSAANASGASPPSNAVTLTFPGACTGVPGAPAHLQTWKVGNTIFLAWSPPTGGTAATSYAVWVSGAYVGSFGTTGRTLSGAAGPGSYALSVTANNACGAGPATPTQTVVMP